MSTTAERIIDIGRLRARFPARVVEAENGCHLWTGYRDEWGYGRTSVGRRTLAAHRASWVLAYGPIPDGLCVLHRCDTPACVRPDHLFLGTPADNMRDRDAKGRCARQGGEGNGATRLRWHNVVYIRELYAEGASQAAIAAVYGLSPSTVGSIVRGETWRGP